jgi:hypothetical protein
MKPHEWAETEEVVKKDRWDVVVEQVFGLVVVVFIGAFAWALSHWIGRVSLMLQDFGY